MEMVVTVCLCAAFTVALIIMFGIYGLIFGLGLSSLILLKK